MVYVTTVICQIVTKGLYVFGRFQQFGERPLSGEWCKDVYKHIKSINVNGIESPKNMDSFNNHANYLAKLIHSCLPAYFIYDSQRSKNRNLLQLGQHWVWDSFSSGKLVQVAAMMILSKHVSSLERLKNYQFGECLLQYISFLSLVTGDLADLDGSYGVTDGGQRFLSDDATWSFGNGYEQSLAGT
jgi:hypothetical protein